jgi:hypothetical protein
MHVHYLGAIKNWNNIRNVRKIKMYIWEVGNENYNLELFSRHPSPPPPYLYIIYQFSISFYIFAKKILRIYIHKENMSFYSILIHSFYSKIFLILPLGWKFHQHTRDIV